MIRALRIRWHLARARKALTDHDVYNALARQALDLSGKHIARADDLFAASERRRVAHG